MLACLCLEDPCPCQPPCLCPCHRCACGRGCAGGQSWGQAAAEPLRAPPSLQGPQESHPPQRLLEWPPVHQLLLLLLLLPSLLLQNFLTKFQKRIAVIGMRSVGGGGTVGGAKIMWNNTKVEVVHAWQLLSITICKDYCLRRLPSMPALAGVPDVHVLMRALMTTIICDDMECCVHGHLSFCCLCKHHCCKRHIRQATQVTIHIHAASQLLCSWEPTVCWFTEVTCCNTDPSIITTVDSIILMM